jgi:hypothetical protein
VPAEKRAQIIAALKNNPNAAQIARQVGGVSRMTVWKIAKAERIELTAGGPQKISVPNCEDDAARVEGRKRS